MAGWIKLHRSMLDWEWYDDVNVCRLFTHCLLRANHKTKSWRGKTIERGQFWTSLDTLSAETKLSKKQIRVALTKLESTGEVANKGHATGRMVTIVNYDSYQEEGRPRADQGQADGRLGAANKNVNNEENEKNKDLSPNGLPPCQHKKISELYMKLLPEMPAIFSMSDKRKASLSAAWKSDERFQTVEFWEMTFNYVRTSDFNGQDTKVQRCNIRLDH